MQGDASADDVRLTFSSCIHAGRLLDGNRTPELQRDFLLHEEQMRSPDHALKKRILHIRHRRCLVVPASPGWRSGFV
jgi:hypothetical protein